MTDIVEYICGYVLEKVLVEIHEKNKGLSTISVFICCVLNNVYIVISEEIGL